jgi:hypothetical protein
MVIKVYSLKAPHNITIDKAIDISDISKPWEISREL